MPGARGIGVGWGSQGEWGSQMKRGSQGRNGHSGGLGCLGGMGLQSGMEHPGGMGCPGGMGYSLSMPCSLGEGCRAAERQCLWLQSREGVNWIRVPPSLLNSLIHFLCSYFFLSLSSSLSCRLIKNSLSLKVFVSKQLSCQLGAKQ